MYCSKCGTKLNDGAAFCPTCGTCVKAVPAPEKNKGMSEEDLIMTLGIVGICLWAVGFGLPAFVLSLIAVVKARKLKKTVGALNGNARLGDILSIITLVISGLSIVASAVVSVLGIISYGIGMSLFRSILREAFSSFEENMYTVIAYAPRLI